MKLHEKIINYISEDFRMTIEGIKRMPNNSKNWLSAIYMYITKLRTKIENAPLQKVFNERIQFPIWDKICSLISIYIANKLKLA